jgi:uncharacterized membrane protein YdfJ with MMPL/SSD domain
MTAATAPVPPGQAMNMTPGRHRPRATLSVTGITWWSLRHKRVVVGFWVLLTLAGMGFASRAAKALSQQFSIPGRESYQANLAISRSFGNGGSGAPW